MTLISILFALIIERLGAKEACWQLSTYSQAYLAKSQNQSWFGNLMRKQLGLFVWLLFPAGVVFVLTHVFDFFLIELAVNVAVLLVCIGCAKQREWYKGYLNALQRQDNEAASLYALQLGQFKTEQQGGETLGQTIAWLNFRFYVAVVFWFVVLGAPGAIIYGLVRNYADFVRLEPQSALAIHKKVLHKIMYWMDWPAVRIASFGYLIIGNFSQGTGSWLKYVLNFSVPNRTVLGEVALAAEKIEEQYLGCTYEAKCMVRLVKRNMLLMLALVALLTLFGLVP